MKTLVSRRALLKGGLAVGAGLAVGFPVVRAARGVALAETPGVFAPNQWLRINRDGVVTITNSVPEMGQGSLTTTPMIIADELDVDLRLFAIDGERDHGDLLGQHVPRLR